MSGTTESSETYSASTPYHLGVNGWFFNSAMERPTRSRSTAVTNLHAILSPNPITVSFDLGDISSMTLEDDERRGSVNDNIHQPVLPSRMTAVRRSLFLSLFLVLQGLWGC